MGIPLDQRAAAADRFLGGAPAEASAEAPADSAAKKPWGFGNWPAGVSSLQASAGASAAGPPVQLGYGSVPDVRKRGPACFLDQQMANHQATLAKPQAQQQNLIRGSSMRPTGVAPMGQPTSRRMVEAKPSDQDQWCCPQRETCNYLDKPACRGRWNGRPCLAPQPIPMGQWFAPAGATPPRSLAMKDDVLAHALSLLQPGAKLTRNTTAPARQQRCTHARAADSGLSYAAAVSPKPFPPTASATAAPQVPQTTLDQAPLAVTGIATPMAPQPAAATGSANAVTALNLEEVALETAATACAVFGEAAPAADPPMAYEFGLSMLELLVQHQHQAQQAEAQEQQSTTAPQPLGEPLVKAVARQRIAQAELRVATTQLEVAKEELKAAQTELEARTALDAAA